MGQNERVDPVMLEASGQFDSRLRRLNSLNEHRFKEWVFLSAMLFGLSGKWWGDRGRRDTTHEGLDICFYRTADGNIRRLGEGTKVPVMFGGEVVNIIDDFLGKSVFVRHSGTDNDGRRLYTIYGHLAPADSVVPGSVLSAGNVIGVVAAGRLGGAEDIAHLHITVAWIPDSVNARDLDWKTVSDPMKVVLIDPLSVISCPYSIVDTL